MAGTPAFDLRVGITWTQKGLPELLAQARQELNRLTQSASTGTVTGASGGKASQKEVDQYLGTLQKELTAQAKRLGPEAEKAVRSIFTEARSGLKESRKTGAAANRAAREQATAREKADRDSEGQGFRDLARQARERERQRAKQVEVAGGNPRVAQVMAIERRNARLAREAQERAASDETAKGRDKKAAQAPPDPADAARRRAAEAAAKKATPPPVPKKAAAPPAPPQKPPKPPAAATPPPEPPPRTPAQKSAAAKTPTRASDDRAQDIAEKKRQRAADRASAEKILAGDNDYIRSQRKIARGKAKQEQKIEEGNAADDKYRDIQVATSRAKAQQRGREEQSKAADDGFRDAQIAAKRGRAQQAARAEEGAAADKGFQEAQLGAARGKAAQKANDEQNKAADSQYLEEQLRAARGKAEQRAVLEQGKAVDTEYIAQQTAAARGKMAQKAAEEQAKLADVQYTEEQIKAARFKAQQGQLAAEGIASDEEYIAANVAAAKARQLGSARETLVGAGQSYKDMTAEETIARSAVVSRAQADSARAAAARAVTDEDIASMARRRAEEAKLNSSIKAREKAYLRDAIKSGELQEMGLGGTRWQRLTARFNARGTGIPTDEPTLKQFAGQKTTQTLGYGVTGAATGALFFGIGDVIKDASTLESTFVKLKGQLDQLGRGGDFDRVREGIKGIAVDTGIAATDVTDFTQRLIGIYSSDPNVDAVQKAMEQTSAAMKLSVVSGLELKTLMESLVPTSQAFGEDMNDIGDLAVTFSDRYGVSVDQFVQFAGKAAVVSEKSGLGLRELAVTAGNMSKYLGVSLETSAESFNKLPELVQRNQSKITEVLRAGGEESAKAIPDFQAQLRNGQAGQAALTVLQAGSTIGDEKLKSELAGLIAVNREVEQGTAFLNAGAQIREDFKNGVLDTADAAGAMDKRYKSLSDTVTQTFKRIGRAVENMGETLYRSGLAEVFSTAGQSVEALIQVVTKLGEAYKFLNDASKFDWAQGAVPGGTINSLVKFGVVASLASKALGFLRGVMGKPSPAATAENTDAAARARVGTAARGAAAGIGEQTAARETGIGVAGQSATAENADAAARAAGGRRAGQELPAVRRARRNTEGDWVDRETGLPVATPLGARKDFGKLPTVARAKRDANGNWVDRETGERVATPAGAQPGFANRMAREQAAAAAQFGLFQKATYGSKFGLFSGSDVAAKAAGRSTATGSWKPNAGQGLAVAGMVIAGGALVKEAYDNQRTQLDSQSDALRAQMMKTDRKRLEQIQDDRSDFFDRFRLRLFGQELPEEMARAASAEQIYKPAASRSTALAESAPMRQLFAKKISDANLNVLNTFLNQNQDTQKFAESIGGQVTGSAPTSGGRYTQVGAKRVTATRQNLDKMIADANAVVAGTKEGDKDAAKLFLEGVQRVAATQGDMVDLTGEIDKLAKSGDLKRAVDLAGGDVSSVIGSQLDTVRRQHDAGQISTGTYLQKLREERQRLKDSLQGLSVDQQEEALQSIAASEIEDRKVIDDLLISRSKIAGQIAQIQGSNNAPGAELQSRLQLLPQLSLDSQIASLPDLITTMQGSFEAELKAIADPVQRARKALQGYTIPEEVQNLFVVQQIEANPEMEAMVETLKPVIGQSLDQMVEWVARIIRENKGSIEQAMYQMLMEQRQKIIEEMRSQPGGEEYLPEADPRIQAIDTQANRVVQSMGGGKAGQAIAGLSGYLNMTSEQMTSWVRIIAKERGISIEEAFKQLVAEQRARVEHDARENDGIIDEQEQASLNFLDSLGSDSGASFAGTTPQTVGAAGKTGTNADSRRAVLEAENAKRKLDIDTRVSMEPRNNLAKAEADVDQAMADVALEQAAIAQGANGDTSKLQEAQNRLRDAQSNKVQAVRDIEDAQMAWAEVLAGDDPVAQNAAKMQQAQVNLLRARQDKDPGSIIRGEQEVFKLQKEGEKNQQAILASRLDVQAAIFEKDPVKSAQIALQQAEAAVANAEGEQAKNEAEAARIRASRSLEDALSGLIESRANLAIAYADAAGDTVRSAEIAVEEAQRKLDEATAGGAAEGEVNQLTGALATANANLFRTRLSEDQETIDYMKEMGQITVSQALEGYRALLARTQEGTDEYRSLMRAIKSLEDEAGTDFQFNLPTTLGLPTLYEARRTTQSMGQGIGYQDNRNVVVAINVNGAQDPAAVAAQVSDALQSSLRGGSTYTPAVPVGAY